MKTHSTKLLLVVALGFGVATLSRGQTSNEALSALARDAISIEPARSLPALKQLRAAGPAGLDALFAEHASLIAEHSKAAASVASVKSDPSWDRLTSALDAVGQQHDCATSHLYWFTDLGAAKAQARELGKPILSLRLLGRLSEEKSCANSRFFRTVLYANAEVGRRLREQFVLHWESERPVPKVTVDFGDGRKLERTITGNSIHYILDPDGRPVDALPGLYAPQPFLAALEQVREMALRLAATPDGERAVALRGYHERRLSELEDQWAANTRYAGLAHLSLASLTIEDSQESIPWEKIAAAASKTLAPPKESSLTTLRHPAAQQARPLAISRSGVETPLLKAITPPYFSLDASSIALIRAQNPTASQAMPLTTSKSFTKTPLLRMISAFQRTLASDTVRNEYLFHAQLHRWFIAQSGSADLATLNRKVYAELFLTPASDPWLGLATNDTYTALTDNGKR